MLTNTCMLLIHLCSKLRSSIFWKALIPKSLIAVYNVISGGLCVNCDATEHISQSIDVIRICYAVMLRAYWWSYCLLRNKISFVKSLS